MFDGNGRMFVLENPGYMADKEANGELDPVGRISLWSDTNNDGVYDKHTIFVDHMVFPRFVTPYGPNTILTKESNAKRSGSTPTPTATAWPTRRSCSAPVTAGSTTSSRKRAP